MDTNALYKITQGLYILGSKDGNRAVGSLVDAVMQVANQPLVLALSCHNKSFTKSCIEKTGCFSLSALSLETSNLIIENFGFYSSKNRNKWDFVDHSFYNGIPFLTDNIAVFVCDVMQTIVFESNTLFLGRVVMAKDNKDREPLTYRYYRVNLKSSIVNLKQQNKEVKMSDNRDKHWICTVCGYVYDGDTPFEELPDTWLCPICGLDKSYFVYE